MSVAPDKVLDCLGLFCPMPVLRVRETLGRMEPGQVLEMASDDPASVEDMRRWTERMGHQLLEIGKDGAVFRFLVRKAG